jgi:hypothetical protein
MATDIGDLYRTSMTLTSPSGGLVNATTMTLTITLPDSTTTVITPVTPVTTGIYQYDYQTIQSGRHVARWVGTGANPGAYVEVFDVLDAIPPYIVSLADAKQQLNITDTSVDDELRIYLESTTSVVERVRNEAVVKRTFTDEIYLPEYFRGIGQVANSAMPYGIDTARFRVALAHSPALSLTSVARVDNTMTWDVTNLHLDPSGIIDVMFGPTLVGHIAVVYVAGYVIIPATFQLAASMIINHLWQTQRGTRGGPRVGGGMSDTTAIPGFGFAIPNRALELLGGGMPGFA